MLRRVALAAFRPARAFATATVRRGFVFIIPFTVSLFPGPGAAGTACPANGPLTGWATSLMAWVWVLQVPPRPVHRSNAEQLIHKVPVVLVDGHLAICDGGTCVSFSLLLCVALCAAGAAAGRCSALAFISYQGNTVGFLDVWAVSRVRMMLRLSMIDVCRELAFPTPRAP